MATVYQFDEAEADLGKVLDQAGAGEDVKITSREGRVFKLVPEAGSGKPRPKRVAGTLNGLIKLDDSFFDPLSEEELRAWEGYED